MRTVVETRMFSAQAARVWTAEQYQDFVVYISSNPDAGAVIPGSGGVRKIRWSKQGSGKRGEFVLFTVTIPITKPGYSLCMIRVSVKVYRLTN